jgi:hypothetical protein
MKMSGQFHAFVTLLLGEKNPFTFCTGDRVGPRANMDAVENTKISDPTDK